MQILEIIKITVKHFKGMVVTVLCILGWMFLWTNLPLTYRYTNSIYNAPINCSKFLPVEQIPLENSCILKNVIIEGSILKQGYEIKNTEGTLLWSVKDFRIRPDEEFKFNNGIPIVSYGVSPDYVSNRVFNGWTWRSYFILVSCLSILFFPLIELILSGLLKLRSKLN